MNELYEAPEVASKMLVAVMGLIETADLTQRQHLVLPMDDPHRFDWDIIPRPEHTGLSLHDLTRSQKILVWDIIAAALPVRTFTQSTQVPQLEHVLRDYEADFLGRALGAWRDPHNYYVTIFGRPGFEDTWAFRFYGHHLGINLTVVKERWILATPSAMGQQPVNYDGTNKPLHDEESAAFRVLGSLTEEQRTRAIVHPVAPADFVTRYVPRIGSVEYPDVRDLGMPQYRLTDKDRHALRLVKDNPTGITGDELTPEAQADLLYVVDKFLERFPAPIAKKLQDDVRAAGLDTVWFTWAGDEHPGTPHYFRVQTPRFLMELVNAIADGDHIHSVLRDFENDLGGEILLAEHPDAMPDRLPWESQGDTRKVSSADLDPQLEL
ncbi:DUF3500 domain-containing protein [Nocardioides sp. GY 10127]|uniref:DUF3500 domain-containing protein n=1 Tax=Nocardioides sp. GY 10127 TaxID=2569762 RepID=UPI0010A77890|nr:DUF3500 domain-containing protein [Nocardioides sp. GY 10127]TIC81768.1 DUF3500 domain-containing protein [Nocardioides sp. GY 10127]